MFIFGCSRGTSQRRFKFEHLNQSRLYHPETVEELLCIIPRLRGLKEINFVLCWPADSAEAVALMISAFKKNVSLEQVNLDSSSLSLERTALPKLEIIVIATNASKRGLTIQVQRLEVGGQRCWSTTILLHPKCV
jgi:hypothetical protein